MNYSNWLQQIPLFQSFGENELESLGGNIRQQSYRQGQFIFRKGDEGTSLYLVKSGSIKIVLPSSMGYEVIVSIFQEGDFFGENSLLDGEPRHADALALNHCDVLVLNRKDFIMFLHSNLYAFELILSLLSKRIRDSYDLVEDMCFLGISARFAKLLIELARLYGKKNGDATAIELTLSQKELGDMIGATRESINKELKYLRQRGIIKKKGKILEIVDFERLKRRTT